MKGCFIADLLIGFSPFVRRHVLARHSTQSFGFDITTCHLFPETRVALVLQVGVEAAHLIAILLGDFIAVSLEDFSFDFN